MAQNRLLHGLEPRAWLDTELVNERQPRPPVRLERVRLTAGAIERQHQLFAERLAVRMFLDEGLECRQERAMVAERQLCEDQILLHRQPQLLELSDRRACGTVELETGEAVAPPERKRLAQVRRGRTGVVAQHGAAALVDETLEPSCVELARREPDDIPRRLGHENVGAERLTQLRDIHLQSVRSGPWRRLAPELVDQPLHRDDLVHTQEQCCQQRPLLRAPESEGAAAESHLERAEDQELGSFS